MLLYPNLIWIFKNVIESKMQSNLLNSLRLFLTCVPSVNIYQAISSTKSGSRGGPCRPSLPTTPKNPRPLHPNSAIHTITHTAYSLRSSALGYCTHSSTPIPSQISRTLTHSYSSSHKSYQHRAACIRPLEVAGSPVQC